MKKKLDLYVCITCLFLAFLIAMSGKRTADEALAARIAPEILRFHVLANSDTKEDQNLKLDVRTCLLDTIYQALGDDATLEETKAYVQQNKNALTDQAETYIRKKGYEYPVSLEVTNCYFPTKTYGDMVFPCGYYDAVRVLIGEGKGKNWWCVLYPPLCFVDSSYAVVPDHSKGILQNSLRYEDYKALLTNQDKVNVRVRFKIAGLFQ